MIKLKHIYPLLLLTIILGCKRSSAIKDGFIPFEVGQIEPQGWLRKWAIEARNGLTGHLDETVWPFTEGWRNSNIKMDQGIPWWPYEQNGYYLDGVVRLGLILKDSFLIKKAEKELSAVLSRQDKDGYFFIDDAKAKSQWSQNMDDKEEMWTSGAVGNHWAIAVFARAALAYYSGTKDTRYLKMLENNYLNFPLFSRQNDSVPVSGIEMQWSRNIENLESMFEVYRYGGDKRILDRALKICKNYESGMVKSWAKDKDFNRTAICHGVTYNELAKLYAIAYPYSEDFDYLKASVDAFDYLYKNHVLPSGVNSSNEYLQGIGAFKASETCDVSDLMWSSIWMARITGNSKYGDWIEKLFFNAFPATVSSDFKKHVYVSACNHIPGINIQHRNEGTFFEPSHIPKCCSGNLNRVIPNYVINMFMKGYRNELVFLTYGPADLKSIGDHLNIEMNTKYPFGDTIRVNLKQIPKRMKLRFRIPEWCSSPEISVNGKNTIEKIDNDGFINLTGSWQSNDQIILIFTGKPRLETGREKIVLFDGKEPYWPANKARPDDQIDGYKEGVSYATLWYGPLLFALPLTDTNTEYEYELNSKAKTNIIAIKNDNDPNWTWELSNVPIKLFVCAKKTKWNLDKEDPELPVVININDSSSVYDSLELIPYGAAKYRVAMFPFAEPNN